MAPNSLETTNKSVLNLKKEENDMKTSQKEYRREIVWRNVLVMIVLHLAAIYSYCWGAFGVGKWQTIVWFWITGFFSSLGVLAGSHRLWSHKSYKAKLPLRIILAFLQTMALQNDIYEWSRDHRVHHKYSETDADPHNAKRGFFFAHMGWLLCKKHPEVIEKGRTIDMSDLWADPVVRFQRRFYVLLVFLIWGVFPIAVPMYFLGEPLMMSIYGNAFRYVLTLHHAWSVNSLAHLYGRRPYDKSINPSENTFVIYGAMGEGYHNYHHTFPYDYSASEHGWQTNFNPATAFIDFFAYIGWAYDRKVVSENTIRDRIERTGDNNQKRGNFNYWLDLIKGFIVISYPIILIFVLRFFLAKK